MLHNTGTRVVEEEGPATPQRAVLGAPSREQAHGGMSIGDLARYLMVSRRVRRAGGRRCCPRERHPAGSPAPGRLHGQRRRSRERPRWRWPDRPGVRPGPRHLERPTSVARRSGELVALGDLDRRPGVLSPVSSAPPGRGAACCRASMDRSPSPPRQSMGSASARFSGARTRALACRGTRACPRARHRSRSARAVGAARSRCPRRGSSRTPGSRIP